MKIRGIIIASLLAFPVGAQEKAPTISIHMAPAEYTKIRAAQNKVDDARAALSSAEQERRTVEHEIVLKHRKDDKIGDSPSCGSNAVFTIGQWAYGSGASVNTLPTQYLSQIDGEWIIFTLGFEECHPA